MKIIPLYGDTEVLLETFLYQALYVEPGEKPFPKEIVQEPHIRKYILNMDMNREFGFLAELDNRYVGAIWGRFLPKESPGYGYYREDYPEITLSVLLDYQKQGIGTKLLDAFMQEAKKRKLPGISLSVSYGNYAIRLYEAFGFQVVEERETDILMTVSLED